MDLNDLTTDIAKKQIRLQMMVELLRQNRYETMANIMIDAEILTKFVLTGKGK